MPLDARLLPRLRLIAQNALGSVGDVTPCFGRQPVSNLVGYIGSFPQNRYSVGSVSLDVFTRNLINGIIVAAQHAT